MDYETHSDWLASTPCGDCRKKYSGCKKWIDADWASEVGKMCKDYDKIGIEPKATSPVQCGMDLSRFKGTTVRIGYHFQQDRPNIGNNVNQTFEEHNLKGGVCDAINRLNDQNRFAPIIIDWIVEE